MLSSKFRRSTFRRTDSVSCWNSEGRLSKLTSESPMYLHFPSFLIASIALTVSSIGVFLSILCKIQASGYNPPNLSIESLIALKQYSGEPSTTLPLSRSPRFPNFVTRKTFERLSPSRSTCPIIFSLCPAP
jgi:hypothetical protein